MDLQEKLQILADSAKYDASCSSSGGKTQKMPGLGSIATSGICHSYSSDGRCISLLKILFTNCCIFNCLYCPNRRDNEIKRACFTPEEVCEITLNFYRRNYIEGLFLSSGIIKSPDYTVSLLIKTLELLRHKYHFRGYIHVKAIPGAREELIKKLGLLADRMSVNVELATDPALKLLAPNKTHENAYKVMKYIRDNKSPQFVPAGQSTQMLVGLPEESDWHILNQSQNLYHNYHLKRVFYSAYIPVNQNKLLPVLNPPLKREHRLYQADWLMRFYHFKVSDLVSKENPHLSLLYDPKESYALSHLDEYPKDINKCSYEELLKVPGIGLKSAKRIMSSRELFPLDFRDLQKLGVVLKRAKYFITCSGKYYLQQSFLAHDIKAKLIPETKSRQLSLFDEEN